MNPRDPMPRQPWWRTRFMFLVVALPLSAVVAGTTTAVIAIRNADQVVKPSATQAPERPAVEGRNHAATGGKR
jgi:hypothetical protein